MKISIKTPFGFISIFNLVLIPLHFSIVVRDYFLDYPDKLIMIHWGHLILAIVIFTASIFYFIKEIDIQTGEFTYRGHRGQITEGDKILINIIRKPYAYLLQFFLFFFNLYAITEIFGL